MSSKTKIRRLLELKGAATNAEIAELLRGQPGQLSFGQRLRDIRKDIQAEGGDLLCEKLRTGIYLYKLQLPPKVEKTGQICFI